MPLFFRIVSLSFTYILLFGFASPCAQLSEQEVDREIVLEVFKVSRVSKHILLPIDIKGKRYHFFLDTAATITGYDTSLRSLLGDFGRSAVLHTIDGEKRIPLFRPPSARLGHLDLPTDKPVLCMDLGKLRDLCKEEIHGLLGMDFLKDRVFRINFDRGEVAFLQSVVSRPGVRIPINSEHFDVPQVKMTIPGFQKQENFLVDTGLVGNDSGCLRAEIFDAIAEQHLLTHAGRSRSETILGSGSAQQGLVKAVSLGNHCHKNLRFSRAKVSLLGMNYWSRYIVTFDFPNRAIYLQKGQQFDRVSDAMEKASETGQVRKR